MWRWLSRAHKPKLLASCIGACGHLPGQHNAACFCHGPCMLVLRGPTQQTYTILQQVQLKIEQNSTTVQFPHAPVMRLGLIRCPCFCLQICDTLRKCSLFLKLPTGQQLLTGNKWHMWQMSLQAKMQFAELGFMRNHLPGLETSHQPPHV